jgi:hypothetical protein
VGVSRSRNSVLSRQPQLQQFAVRLGKGVLYPTPSADPVCFAGSVSNNYSEFIQE